MPANFVVGGSERGTAATWFEEPWNEQPAFPIYFSPSSASNSPPLDIEHQYYLGVGDVEKRQKLLDKLEIHRPRISCASFPTADASFLSGTFRAGIPIVSNLFSWIPVCNIHFNFYFTRYNCIHVWIDRSI